MIITVSTQIDAPLQQVWDAFTQPQHITNWNFAAPEWCCPTAINELEPGGKLNWRMEARDKSMGFDFEGTYVHIDPLRSIQYTIADGRNVEIVFESHGNTVLVTEHFAAENMNPPELQQSGWQAILNMFKSYVETLN